MTIPDEAIAQDPERSKLALLLSVSHHHAGDPARSRSLAKKAVDWGADRRIVARILISAACNDLGRVAQCLDEPDTAMSHFLNAVKLVEHRADAQLLARTRQIRETGNLGLLPDAVAALGAELQRVRSDPDEGVAWLETLQREFALLRQDMARHTLATPSQDPEAGRGGARSMTGTQPAQAEDFKRNPRYSTKAYSQLTGQGGIILVELKSLPRAGLHYAAGSVAGIMGDAMSFCEWYQEPGCCRRMPCEHCSHMRNLEADAPIHIRMTKSHDFDLADPLYPPTAQFRRLILLRDPLFILTSWWCLDLLARHQGALKASGISPISLFYRHNHSLLTAAYKVLDGKTLDCSAEAVSRWIEPKAQYIAGFTKKWVADTQKRSSPYQQIVHYDELSKTIAAFLNTLSERLSAEQRSRLQRYAEARAAPFRPRSDAFRGPTEHITAALQTGRDAFEAAAARLREEDEVGMSDGGNRRS